MTDYTPTTEQIFESYEVRYGSFNAKNDFDRWLASVKAEAWDEGWDAGLQHWWYGLSMHGEFRTDNPYRAEAYRQESGEQ